MRARERPTYVLISMAAGTLVSGLMCDSVRSSPTTGGDRSTRIDVALRLQAQPSEPGVWHGRER